MNRDTNSEYHDLISVITRQIRTNAIMVHALRPVLQ